MSVAISRDISRVCSFRPQSSLASLAHLQLLGQTADLLLKSNFPADHCRLDFVAAPSEARRIFNETREQEWFRSGLVVASHSSVTRLARFARSPELNVPLLLGNILANFQVRLHDLRPDQPLLVKLVAVHGVIRPCRVFGVGQRFARHGGKFVLHRLHFG